MRVHEFRVANRNADQRAAFREAQVLAFTHANEEATEWDYEAASRCRLMFSLLDNEGGHGVSPFSCTVSVKSKQQRKRQDRANSLL